jgi:hypothetical protein
MIFNKISHDHPPFLSDSTLIHQVAAEELHVKGTRTFASSSHLIAVHNCGINIEGTGIHIVL